MLARSLVALFAVSIPLTMFPLGAQAQSSIDLKTTSTPRERVAPPVPDRDLYPQRPSLPQAPQFIEPLTRKTETGRAGVAGFTAPNAPVGSRGSSDPDHPGWAGLGFAVEWGRAGRPGSRAD
jgi:hypothetical protein